MKKWTGFLFLIVFALSAQAQDGTIKAVISNTKTANHINIPGTRLYIIPPAGFTVAKLFLGLQKGENAILNIYDLVGGNYYTNAATFSRGSFEEKGARVFEFKEIRVNGFPCKYLRAQTDIFTNAIAMVFGDSTFSTMIMAAYPASDEQTGRQIINALNTICYDKAKKVDPFATALFTLDDKVSLYKFYQFNAGLYVYTEDGKENNSENDDPFFLVTQLPLEKFMSAKTVAGMMLAKAEEYGMTNQEVKNQSTEKLNGYDAYRAEVYGKMNGKNSLIYMCTVVKGDLAIVMQGIAKKDIEKNLEEFKKLAATVKLK